MREKVFESCPTAMCHASTLLLLDDGRVLCAWFGGSREGEPDVDIYMAVRDEVGWGAPFRMTDAPEPCWNPVLFQLPDGRIALFYKQGAEIKSWRTMLATSVDGVNWVSPREMVPGDRGGRGPVRCKPIRLSSGRILAPGSTEDGIWQAFVDISDDNGATWRKSGPARIDGLNDRSGRRTTSNSQIEVSEQSFYGRGVIQPTLWASASGVHMMLRSSEGRIHRADSLDGGETWSHASPTVLPNNNSGIDLVQLPNGQLALVHNPVGENWGPRSPIVLSVSDDGGLSWRQIITLDGGKGEFSYPAVISNGYTLHISYTRKRESIAYWRIQLDPKGQWRT